ncbi:hypothetical protein [Engelhardtia mirabilis]|uniref:Uncharacterized protein n=1 Tax=Engelhardtia mirabilis TaxID=2528011 RepID=A0A518BFL4_9BACT|nr:hypothetical protein Pla133_08450 [Planctomycetes bacterium Pla133]QDV00105.1 hypothetical protein Pla86_08440 [Planctomycetes bacterium Pla86]
MQERDLLDELLRGELTESEAYAWLDLVMESSVLPKSLELVEMSPAEWSAFTRGLPLLVLASWRIEGWPAECVDCGVEVDIDGLNWVPIRDAEERSGFGLVHPGCR